jgi:hypothetical protein
MHITLPRPCVLPSVAHDYGIASLMHGTMCRPCLELFAVNGTRPFLANPTKNKSAMSVSSMPRILHRPCLQPRVDHAYISMSAMPGAPYRPCQVNMVGIYVYWSCDWRYRSTLYTPRGHLTWRTGGASSSYLPPKLAGESSFSPPPPQPPPHR